jgi:serine/threonine protein kinase
LIEHYQQFNKTVNEDQIYDWSIHLFNALREIHSQNLIHRDLCPENIYLNNGQIKVGGLALVVSMDSLKKTISATTEYAYVCPEAIENRELTSKADVWSAACIIYEVITLKKAFSGENVQKAILNNEIPTVDYPIFVGPILNKYFLNQFQFALLKDLFILSILKECFKDGLKVDLALKRFTQFSTQSGRKKKCLKSQ